jgi:hypothetical protein
MQKNRLFLESAVCLALIALVLMLPELQFADRWLQTFFFDRMAGGWLIQPDERGLLFWALYKLPKILLAVSASLLILYLCARRLARRFLLASGDCHGLAHGGLSDGARPALLFTHACQHAACLGHIEPHHGAFHERGHYFHDLFPAS